MNKRGGHFYDDHIVLMEMSYIDVIQKYSEGFKYSHKCVRLINFSLFLHSSISIKKTCFDLLTFMNNCDRKSVIIQVGNLHSIEYYDTCRFIVATSVVCCCRYWG